MFKGVFPPFRSFPLIGISPHWQSLTYDIERAVKLESSIHPSLSTSFPIFIFCTPFLKSVLNLLLFSMFQAMPQYCDVTQLRRLAVDHQSWRTATCLCLLGRLYPQALHYHLRMLAMQPSKDVPALMAEGAVLAVEYYLRFAQNINIFSLKLCP